MIMKKRIAIILKLYSGLERDLNIADYNPRTGITLEADSEVRLRRILKDLGIKNFSDYVFFSAGERISVWHKLEDGEVISCLRPTGGG